MRKSGHGYAAVSEEEFQRRLADFDTWAGIDWDNPVAGKTWDPVEVGRYTPTPFHVKQWMPLPGEDERWYSWDPALKILSDRKVWFVMGAGASPLRMDLSPLDGEVVYGINWTLKWFCPTFLQIIDRNPLHGQVAKSSKWKEYQGQRTQLVSSRWAAEKYMGKHRKGCLCFEIHHPANRKKMRSFYFAEKPEPALDNKMTWYPNSLAYALNVAYWFRPKRVVILGCDFGGPHFFGDGRTQGCQGHYGIRKMGGPRGKLIPHLVELRDHLLERGQDLVQVGPTRLDVFPVADSLEEAIGDAGERKYLTREWVNEWRERSAQAVEGSDEVGLRKSRR